MKHTKKLLSIFIVMALVLMPLSAMALAAETPGEGAENTAVEAEAPAQTQPSTEKMQEAQGSMKGSLAAAQSGDGFVTPFSTSYTWTGAQDSYWSKPLNWLPNSVPGAGDSVIIPSDGAVILDVVADVASVSLSGTIAVMEGGNFTSNTAIITQTGGSLGVGGVEYAVTVGSLEGTGRVYLNMNTLCVDANVSSTYSGVISGTGGIIKKGTGTLTLSGANTYSGLTTVDGGTLALSGAGKLSFGAPLAINAAGTFDISNGGVFTTYDLSGSGGINLGSKSIVIYSDSALSFSGVISGANGSVIKDGIGTLTLSGANTHTGLTEVKKGTLTLTGTGTAGSGAALTVNTGATFNGSAITASSLSVGTISGGGVITLAAKSFITNTSNSNFSGGITCSSFTKGGAGTLTLSGSNLSFERLIVTGGKLALSGAASFSATSSIKVNTGASLDVAGVGGSTISCQGIEGGGNILMGSQALNVTVDSDMEFSGVISGAAGSLIKKGAGTLTLSGVNNYLAGTTITQGTIALKGSGTAGSASPVTVNADATFDISGVSADKALTGSVSGAGNIVLGAKTLNVQTASNSTFSGVISGTGGITKESSGTLALSGANTYTGATTINGGRLSLNGAGTAGINSAVYVKTGATFAITASKTIGSLSGAGNVMLSSSTLTIGADNTSTTFGGEFEYSAAGNLVKQGSGTMIFTKKSTIYNLFIEGGAVQMGDGTQLGSGFLQCNTEISGGGKLIFDLNDPTEVGFVIDNLITGEGSVEQVGSPHINLTNSSNTYTGGTYVKNSGILVDSQSKYGADNSIITMDGSSLVCGESAVLPNEVLATTDMIVAVMEDETLTLAGKLKCAGSLINMKKGTVDITNEAQILGAINVNIGTLRLSVPLAPVAINIAPQATLENKDLLFLATGAMLDNEGAVVNDGLIMAAAAHGTITNMNLLKFDANGGSPDYFAAEPEGVAAFDITKLTRFSAMLPIKDGLPPSGWTAVADTKPLITGQYVFSDGDFIYALWAQAEIANPDNNKLSAPTTIAVGEIFEISAEGDRQNAYDTADISGSTLYMPAKWEINPTGFFTVGGDANGDYKATTSIEQAGKYTLTVTYDLYECSNGVWVKVVGGDVKTTSLTVTAATQDPSPNPDPAAIYTIKASAGSGGGISPEGDVFVNAGEEKTFTFTPDSGWKIRQVTVDGVEVKSSKNSYTFNNVTANHVIKVTFTKDSAAPETGDDGNFIVWLSLLIGMGATVGCVVLRKKTRIE